MSGDVRPRLLCPQAGYEPEVVAGALLVAGVEVPMGVLRSMAPMELAMVYDWAMREHLSAADQPVQRRPKPLILSLTELRRAAGIVP